MAASAHKSHSTHHIKSNLLLGGLDKRFPMDLVLCDPAAIKFVAQNEKKQQLVVACCYLFSFAEIEQLVKEAKAGD